MNANAKHTPGPWIAEIEDYPFRREIYIETQDFDPDAGEGERIARVLDETDNGRANARLIAAAPAMLEALHLAFLELSLFDNTTGNPKDERCAFDSDLFPEPQTREDFENVWQKIRAAIAQAEGGAQ